MKFDKIFNELSKEELTQVHISLKKHLERYEETEEKRETFKLKVEALKTLTENIEPGDAGGLLKQYQKLKDNKAFGNSKEFKKDLSYIEESLFRELKGFTFYYYQTRNFLSSWLPSIKWQFIWKIRW